jgi:hypothetical protein
VSASRLYDIAKELNVPVASFFPAPSQKENGAP